LHHRRGVPLPYGRRLFFRSFFIYYFYDRLLFSFLACASLFVYHIRSWATTLPCFLLSFFILILLSILDICLQHFNLMYVCMYACMCGMGKNGLVLVLARRGGSSVKERGGGGGWDGV